MRQIYAGGRTRYKSFLHHINKNKPSIRNVLKVKEPRKRIQILTKEQVRQTFTATTNIRDAFLIQLLFETGLRIERLFLYIWKTLYLTTKRTSDSLEGSRRIREWCKAQNRRTRDICITTPYGFV